MHKLIILSSFLLLLFLEAVSSRFHTVSDNKGFSVSNDLRGYYRQPNSRKSGYHKAEIRFKTKVPSINPDQAGVSKIKCKDGKITLKLNDKKAIEQIDSWPDKVMLLVSHGWKCFGESTTQFFMVKKVSDDVSKKEVTFTTEKCEIKDWVDDLLVDVSWEDEKSEKRDLTLNKRFRLPTINSSNKLSLNILFNEKTGGSSIPNIPIIKDKLVCANCFVQGEATISLRIASKFNLFKGFKLTEASISLNGNVRLNLDLAAVSELGKSKENIKLLSIPLPGSFGVPGLFNVGPSADLFAEVEVVTNVGGSVGFGGEISLPNFNAKASFANFNPSFEQSGFTPKFEFFKPTFTFSTSARVGAALKPQLSFGVDVVKLIRERVGFEVVGRLDNTFSLNDDRCEKKKPRLETQLNGNLGFFIKDNSFPVVNFPSLNLFDKCL